MTGIEHGLTEILMAYLRRRITKKALQKFIIPRVTSKGYQYTRHDVLERFQFGDFTPTDKKVLKSMRFQQTLKSDIYLYVFFKHRDEERRMTVKISWPWGWIRALTYNPELY